MIDRPPAPQIMEGSFPIRGERQPEDEPVPFADWMTRGIPALRTQLLADGSAASPAAHPASDRAMVFNEDGFFAVSERLPTPQAPALSASALMAPIGAGLGETSIAGDALHEGVAQLANPAVGRSDMRPIASGIARAAAPFQLSDGPRGSALPSSGAAGPTIEPGAFAEAETVRANEGHAARAADVRAYRTRAQSTLCIAIRDIEHGLQILVAAQALDKEERERLAHEIAALLSRHGLVARDTRIAGSAQARDPGRS